MHVELVDEAPRGNDPGGAIRLRRVCHSSRCHVRDEVVADLGGACGEVRRAVRYLRDDLRPRDLQELDAAQPRRHTLGVGREIEPKDRAPSVQDHDEVELEELQLFDDVAGQAVEVPPRSNRHLNRVAQGRHDLDVSRQLSRGIVFQLCHDVPELPVQLGELSLLHVVRQHTRQRGGQREHDHHEERRERRDETGADAGTDRRPQPCRHGQVTGQLETMRDVSERRDGAGPETRIRIERGQHLRHRDGESPRRQAPISPRTVLERTRQRGCGEKEGSAGRREQERLLDRHDRSGAGADPEASRNAHEHEGEADGPGGRQQLFPVGLEGVLADGERPPVEDLG